MQTQNPSILLIIERQKKLEKVKQRKKLTRQILLTFLTAQLIIFGNSPRNTKENINKNKIASSRIAFYIQNLNIKKDKSIGNPAFFKYIPDEYKSTVVFIKDGNQKVLNSYLQTKLSQEEIKIYNNEIEQNKKNYINKSNER